MSGNVAPIKFVFTQNGRTETRTINIQKGLVFNFSGVSDRTEEHTMNKTYKVGNDGKLYMKCFGADIKVPAANVSQDIVATLQGLSRMNKSDGKEFTLTSKDLVEANYDKNGASTNVGAVLSYIDSPYYAPEGMTSRIVEDNTIKYNFKLGARYSNGDYAGSPIRISVFDANNPEKFR